MSATENTKRTKSGPAGKAVTAVSAVLCVVLAFMLVCNLTIIVKGSLHPEMPPSVLGNTPLIVLSGSMSGDAPDHIEVGDLIFVDKVEPEDLAVGDIIAYMEGSVVVTHRIIEINTGADGLEFTTKGDANNAADLRPVSAANLVGIYSFRIPKVGDFALFLQTPMGMLLFIGVPLLSFLLYDIIRRTRTAKKEDKRTAELEAELERLRALAGEKKET